MMKKMFWDMVPRKLVDKRQSLGENASIFRAKYVHSVLY